MANLSHGAGALPFPRGTTYSQGVLAMTPAMGVNLEGTVWEIYDPKQGMVKLRVVRNSSGGALTKSKKLLAYASDYAGKRVSGTGVAGSAACVADDQYPDGMQIPQDDLFYVMESGVVQVSKATGASTAIALHAALTSGASGNAAVAAAGQRVVGYCAKAATDGDAVVSVYVG